MVTSTPAIPQKRRDQRRKESARIRRQRSSTKYLHLSQVFEIIPGSPLNNSLERGKHTRRHQPNNKLPIPSRFCFNKVPLDSKTKSGKEPPFRTFDPLLQQQQLFPIAIAWLRLPFSSTILSRLFFSSLADQPTSTTYQVNEDEPTLEHCSRLHRLLPINTTPKHIATMETPAMPMPQDEREQAILDRLSAIRDRLLLLKRDRTKYIRTQDVIVHYDEVVEQVRELNEIRKGQKVTETRGMRIVLYKLLLNKEI